MRWHRAIAGSLALGALAFMGCGVDTGIAGVPVLPVPAKWDRHGSEPKIPLDRRMPGLWREDGETLASYYWFHADGTGERLRRTLDPAGPREPVARKFTWKADGDRLEVQFDEEPAALTWDWVSDDRDGDVLTLKTAWAPKIAWFGCASGKIPSEYTALCGQ